MQPSFSSTALVKESSGFFVHHQSFSSLPILLTSFVASILNLFLALSSSSILPLSRHWSSFFLWQSFSSPLKNKLRVSVEPSSPLFGPSAVLQLSSMLCSLTRPDSQRCTRGLFCLGVRGLCGNWVREDGSRGQRERAVIWKQEMTKTGWKQVQKKEIKSRNIRYVNQHGINEFPLRYLGWALLLLLWDRRRLIRLWSNTVFGVTLQLWQFSAAILRLFLSLIRNLV